MDQRQEVRTHEAGERRKLPARGKGSWGGNQVQGEVSVTVL